jgi:phytanoyl-CoA hydroxylase
MKRLTKAQHAQFFEEGYVVVPEVFASEALTPLCDEIAGLLDDCVLELALPDGFNDAPFETRLTLLLDAYPEHKPHFFRAIEGRAGGGHTGRALFDVLTDPNLLDAMEDLMGPELIASSVYRIRPKVPGLARGVVPWHQDSGYFSAHCDKDLIVTCWIPLVDATIENGCLCVLPKTHHGPVVPHHTGGNAGFLVIHDEDLPAPASAAISIPVPRGSVLLLTNRTPHCSTANTTDIIRWSIDLRYQSAAVPTNALLWPEDADVTAACYPPEGDFIVRSEKDPALVSAYESFSARRNAYERAGISGPNRGWKPS